MRKISLVLGKPAISAVNGDYLGTVTGVLCGKGLKTVEYLNILKQNDALDDYLFVAPRSVKLITDECVLLSNSLCIKNASDVKLANTVDFPLGGAVYSADGKNVGTVADLHFADTEKKVICAITEDGLEILPEKISSVTAGVITLLPDGVTRKRSGAPKKIKPPEEDFVVTLFDDNSSPVAEEKPFTPEIQPVALEEAVKKPVFRSFMPNRVICNYRFLLGRYVVANVYDRHRVPIVKKGTLITVDVVLAAHAAGKLVELTLNSRL